MPYSPVVMLDDSSIKIQEALYLICQFASGSAVYKVNILDGKSACHDKTLTPHCIMHTFICDDEYDLLNQPFPWHSVCGPSYIYTVPSKENEIYTFNLHSGTLDRSDTRKPVNAGSLALVLRVGGRIIAITDTPNSVYHLSYHQHRWAHRITHGPVDLKRKINLSGYVVLTEDSFIVSDADSNCCFLLDLLNDEWCAVIPHYRIGLLARRSVYVDGFIYTCTDGGLAAYELTGHDGSYYLGDGIDLQFSWRKFSERERMCFDYLGKDTVSGTIMFCVVQGDDDDLCASQRNHPVRIDHHCSG